MPLETSNWSYESYDSSDTLFHIDEMSTTPTRLSAGQPFEGCLRGRLLKPVEEGAYVDVVIKLGAVKVLNKTFDLNEPLGFVNSKLPLSSGSIDFLWRDTLPKEIPPSKFIIQLNAFTMDDDELFSVKVVVDFTRKPYA